MTAKDISAQHISPSPADSVPVVLALDDPLATDVALTGVYRWFGDAYEQMQNDAQKALGLEPTVIHRMSDSELKQYVNETISCQKEWVEDLWTGFFTRVPAVTSAFVWMLSHWYMGTNANVFADLITGLPKPTITLRENLAMWQLAEKIRASDTLVRLFEENKDEAFLKACERVPEGFEFLADYRVFLAEFGPRGHADRDIWYARRIEDPSIDYRIFSVFLASGSQPPGSGEHHLIARREAATDDVLESIRSRRPFGSAEELRPLPQRVVAANVHPWQRNRLCGLGNHFECRTAGRCSSRCRHQPRNRGWNGTNRS